MKKRILEIMDKFHQYNSDNMAYQAFGLDSAEHYDALVVAPGFSPYKLKMEEYCRVTTLKEGAYLADVFQVLEENDFSDAGKDIIYDYVLNQSRAVRETICELVRSAYFPDRPSRLKCLYVCKTLEEAYIWKNNFEKNNRKVLQLVELSSDGEAFTGDAVFLPKINGDSFEKN